MNSRFDHVYDYQHGAVRNTLCYLAVKFQVPCIKLIL